MNPVRKFVRNPCLNDLVKVDLLIFCDVIDRFVDVKMVFSIDNDVDRLAFIAVSDLSSPWKIVS